MTLEERIGYRFREPELLAHALRHSSYANEHGMKKWENNERLEFLGDAVLELISSRYLYERYPTSPEGKLTRERASMVCEDALYQVALKLGLDVDVCLGKGEDKTGGRKRPSVLSDALEALIGAMYLDGGIEPCKQFIEKKILRAPSEKGVDRDHKTRLQELVQGRGMQIPEYQLIEESGPDHNKEFRVLVTLGNGITATGSGHSKKAAEQNAAYEAIKYVSENH